MQQTFLNKLLNETKNDRKTFLENREYAQAAAMRAKSVKQSEEMKKAVDSEIVRKQQTEKRRLAIARDVALHKVHEDVTKQVEEIERICDEKHLQLLAKHEQVVQLYEQRVRARETQKPIVHSSYVRDLQRSEKRLANFDMYDESDQVRRKIQQREVEEHREALEQREERIQKCVDMKREQLKNDESFFLAKMRNQVALAQFRASQEEERVAHQYTHFQKDMDHSQLCEQQTNPLVLAYQRPPKMMRLNANRPATTSTKTRGSELLNKMQGTRYSIPSLCDLYGALLDDESGVAVTAANATTGREMAPTTAAANGKSAQQPNWEEDFDDEVFTKSVCVPVAMAAVETRNIDGFALASGFQTLPPLPSSARVPRISQQQIITSAVKRKNNEEQRGNTAIKNNNGNMMLSAPKTKAPRKPLVKTL